MVGNKNNKNPRQIDLCRGKNHIIEHEERQWPYPSLKYPAGVFGRGKQKYGANGSPVNVNYNDTKHHWRVMKYPIGGVEVDWNLDMANACAITWIPIEMKTLNKEELIEHMKYKEVILEKKEETDSENEYIEFYKESKDIINKAFALAVRGIEL